MSFLATVIADVIARLAEMLGADLSDYWKKREAEKAAQAAEDAAAKTSVEPLKKAQDGKDVDDAADDALNGV